MSYATIQNPTAYDNAVRRNIIANAQKTFYKTYDDAQAIIGYLMDNAERNDFCSSLFDSFSTYGKLTENQIKAVRASMVRQAEWNAKRAEEKAQRQQQAAEKSNNAGYIGTVKARIVLTFKVNKIIAMAGVYGWSYLHICENEAGQAIVYKGTVKLADEGENVTVKATIKEHSIYNGIFQTVINRPAFLD